MHLRVTLATIAFFTLASISLSSIARAGDKLISVGKDTKNNEYFLNLDLSKALENGIVDYIYRMRLPKPDEDDVLVVDIHSIGHCKSNRAGMHSIQLYNSQNKLVSEKKFETLDIDEVNPNSPAEVVLKKACETLYPVYDQLPNKIKGAQ
jgi:hypothetical protein